MANTGKRKPSSKTTSKKTAQPTQKALNFSAPIWILILIIIAGVIYAAVLESDTIETPTPPAAVQNFIEKDATLSIHYIDVGQGDSSLIVFGDSAVLVDAGEKEMGSVVAAYLNELGLTKLDYIVATHPHSDHIGGLPEVIKGFEFDKVIAPRVTAELTPTTKSYENFLLALKNKGKKLTAAKAGEKYTLYSNKNAVNDTNEKTETAEIEIIAPISPQSDSYDDLNDFSVVFKLTYKNTSYLFTGDASKPAEKDILESGADISADVLKVGHHGSSTASTANFINAVSASVGVIQCGQDNSYNHPNEKIVERLENANIILYRNDLDGTVIVYSDGEDIRVEKVKKK